jgi:hypothetical protein
MPRIHGQASGSVVSIMQRIPVIYTVWAPDRIVAEFHLGCGDRETWLLDRLRRTAEVFGGTCGDNTKPSHRPIEDSSSWTRLQKASRNTSMVSEIFEMIASLPRAGSPLPRVLPRTLSSRTTVIFRVVFALVPAALPPAQAEEPPLAETLTWMDSTYNSHEGSGGGFGHGGEEIFSDGKPFKRRFSSFTYNDSDITLTNRDDLPRHYTVICILRLRPHSVTLK